MKKKIVIIISILIIAAFFLLNVSTVKIIGDKASVRYIYGDKNITAELSDEDAEVIIEILNGKHISIFDLPSCGFDDNVAVIINGKTFCIACDECGTVYFKERNCCIILENDENIELRNILSNYGFEWPCH